MPNFPQMAKAIWHSLWKHVIIDLNFETSPLELTVNPSVCVWRGGYMNGIIPYIKDYIEYKGCVAFQMPFD